MRRDRGTLVDARRAGAPDAATPRHARAGEHLANPAHRNARYVRRVQVYTADIDTPASVIRDLHDAGRIVICYFSAGTMSRFAATPRAFRGEPRRAARQLS